MEVLSWTFWDDDVTASVSFLLGDFFLPIPIKRSLMLEMVQMKEQEIQLLSVLFGCEGVTSISESPSCCQEAVFRNVERSESTKNE